MALAPTYGSSAVATNGNTVAVTFTLGTGTSPLLPSTAVTGFTLTIAGTAYTVTGTATGLVVTLTSPKTITARQAVSVAYTPGNLTDSQGSPVAVLAFTIRAVTNSSTVAVSSSGITSRLIGSVADAVNLVGYANVNPLHTFTLVGGGSISRVATVTESYVYDVAGGYQTDSVDVSGDLVSSIYTPVATPLG